MKTKIVVHDALQRYTYFRTEPVGKHFDPRFKPQLTPQEMLRLGVFGGSYFDGVTDEFPASWWKGAKVSSTYNKKLNYFGVKASQSRAEWARKGWLNADDPRGWFQWYCRYYLGRRHSDDERQIKRWMNIGRHVAQVRANCRAGDETCRPVQRQALLHWAVDSRAL